MKTLTVCQPYASAIIEGIKTVENRTWKTNYRGPLVIHAGKSMAWFNKIPFHQLELMKTFWPYDQLHMGKILGIIDLVDIVKGNFETQTKLFDIKDGETLETDPFVTGPYCWMLENPIKLKEPFPYKGQMKLFDIPIFDL
ncbi:hypothetical protein ES705_21970 [subsurface metagenome]